VDIDGDEARRNRAPTTLMASTAQVEEVVVMFAVQHGSTLRRNGRPGDSAEDWELPIGARTAWAWPRSGFPARPYRAYAYAAVPERAVAALVDTVGVRSPQAMFVVPAATRRRRHVYTPTQVLGVGTGGVALWANQLPWGRVVADIRYAS
jgi:hypothetical protein